MLPPSAWERGVKMGTGGGGERVKPALFFRPTPVLLL